MAFFLTFFNKTTKLSVILNVKCRTFAFKRFFKEDISQYFFALSHFIYQSFLPSSLYVQINNDGFRAYAFLRLIILSKSMVQETHIYEKKIDSN